MNGESIPWAGGRVAVVHDWFQGYHGAERVVEALVRDVFAEARDVDVFTFHAARDLLPDELASRIVRESRVAALGPFRQRGHEPGRWRLLLPLMSRYFRSLDLRSYDLVVASSHAAAAHASPPAGTPYVCYCHSPMRYLWLSDAERGRLSGPTALALRVLSPGLRRRDRRAAQRPDRYVANSEAVRDRIARFYGRPAEVIHPPVAVSDLTPSAPKAPDTFLWVNRLVAYKRPETVVEAFRGTRHRLTMVGIGPLEQRIRDRLPENVELRGWLSRPELTRLYESSGGLIHIGEEDFGMAMVEALAAGSPVIALDGGGARDIVEDGTHGVLLADPTVASLREAIDRVAATDWDAGALAARAASFSPERFVARMREVSAAAISGS